MKKNIKTYSQQHTDMIGMLIIISIITIQTLFLAGYHWVFILIIIPIILQINRHNTLEVF